MSLHVLQGDDGTFLHHVAQISGQRELTGLAFGERCLDEENLSAYACPGQSGHHAGVIVALIDVAIEWRLTQQVFNLRRVDGRGRQFSLQSFAESKLSQGFVNLLFQLSHAALTCILLDNLFQSLLGKLELWVVLVESCVLQLTGNKVAFGYLNLLLGDVSRHLDDLHTVEQRARNGVEVVGSGNEERLGEVVVYVEEVVVEGRVLLWVEHFEQCRRRVAIDSVLCHLVNLIENEYGIRRASLLNALDDAARHGANIGSSVSANLTLVVQSAQRHAHILAFHGRGDALAERCLAHARRTIEADDGRLQIAAQLQYGQIFEYSLLDFLHAVVVLVEHFLSALEIETILCVFAPGQSGHLLQVVELHAILRTLWVKHVELVQFLVEYLGNILRPVHLLGLVEQLGLLRRAVGTAEFLLDVLHLLLQEVFLLLLVEVLPRLLVNLILELLQLNLTVLNLQQFDDALLEVANFEQLDLVFHRQRQVSAHEIGEHHGVGEVLDGHHYVIRNLVTALHKLLCRGVQIVDQGLEFGVVVGRKLLGRGSHDALVVGLDGRDALELTLAQRLENGRHVVWCGHLDDAHQTCIDTILIEFVACGRVYVGVALAEYGADIVLGALAQLLGQVHTCLSSDQDGYQNPWKKDHVAGGKYGNLIRCRRVQQTGNITVEVSKHLYRGILFFAHCWILKQFLKWKSTCGGATFYIILQSYE